MARIDELTMRQIELDKAEPCHDCGEHGRFKGLINVHRALKLYCHDEEKSCFNYVLIQQRGMRAVA